MQRMRPIQPRRLEGGAALAATLAAATAVAIGFVFPALHLVHEAAKRMTRADLSPALLGAAANTVMVAASAASAAAAAGLVVAWTTRGATGALQGPWRWLLARGASLGYAVPGTVLAVGLLAPAVALDYLLGDLFGYKKLLLLGSGAVLVAGCTIRFMAIARPPVSGRWCAGDEDQAICRFCTAASSSWKLGMCWLGAILRPVSTLTCGALPCRWATSTARITSKYLLSSSTTPFSRPAKGAATP